MAYAGGLRVSEIVALTWADVLSRDEGRVPLSITGKGGKVRQVLLPEIVSRCDEKIYGGGCDGWTGQRAFCRIIVCANVREHPQRR